MKNKSSTFFSRNIDSDSVGIGSREKKRNEKVLDKSNVFLVLLFGCMLIAVFYRWFFGGDIIGGDWPYLFKESLGNYHFLVPSWNAWQGNGLGGTNPIYFLQSFEYLTVFLANLLHIPWSIIYKIFWFGLFIALSISSSIYLLKTISSSVRLWQMGVAALIFTTNTYILMVVGGGQMGIALAYSIAPFVLGVFIKLISLISSSDSNSKFKIQNSKLSVLAGLVLSFQVLFDPRIAGITMIAVVIYLILNIKKSMLNSLYLILNTLIIPALVTILLHTFWILPLFIFSQDLYQRFGESDSGIGIIKFLSFSSFSQSFSLLHSNWPENIFGKVGFMKAEFILLPIIACSGLLFKPGRRILFFVLLGIVGAFLAKGANPPFGDFYLWLSENIPGFSMFRDSTKFYLLVVLSYSILIPFSFYSLSEWFNSKFQPSPALRPASKSQNYLVIVLFLFFVGYWGILIHPAILGQLKGTFKRNEVPKEYTELKNFLYEQPEFFRTLWVPRQHRFTFFSNLHPSVEAGPLFNATRSSEIIRELKKIDSQEYLSELSIKYVIVPYDSLGEFFLTDRKYDKNIPSEISKNLEAIPWLKKIDRFGNLTVFETLSPKDHFWLEKSGKISYKTISSTQHVVNISTTYGQKLIFSEKYNPSWVAKMGDVIIESQRTSANLNSFSLEKDEHDLEIIFLQDRVYNYGRIISLITLLSVLFFVFKYRKLNSLSN